LTYETIAYEVSDAVAAITLNRPDQLNAVNRKMCEELSDAYNRAEADDSVWTVVVTGAGRAFCSGADVTDIQEDGKVPHQGTYLSSYDQWDVPQEATPPFRTMAKPVVVAVNGLCCGAGLDLVTTGDVVVASDRAEFFDPHTSIGREVVRLARVLPLNVAMRMALMGRQERLSASRAFDLGLVTEVIPHESLAERTAEIVALLHRNAPLAVRGTRLAIRKGLGLPLYEAELLAETYRERVTRTEDAVEGPRSFLERREPRWKAR
jgi:enoyl-CoA hydratase/carnithine racemase